tara:strand:+ start:1123 stop:1449 length:327 start_codon:yes stop_codon:yes gene_type:complete
LISKQPAKRANGQTGKRCFIEAKGATSSKVGSKRYGLEFNSNQVKTHIGVALLKLFQTLQQHPHAEVVIALPDNPGHRKVLESMFTPLKSSGIKVYLVNTDGGVNILV